MNFEQALNERKFKYGKREYKMDMRDSSFRDKELMHNPTLKSKYCKYCGAQLKKNSTKCPECRKDTAWEPWSKK